ncbi:MAG: phosphoribosylamine--glycine ligase [Candidatus Omnitrophica bacterium]|nr:phosphoribosylamine--glycine ligase [Candidatus Omnitrophota bacterium]
MKVLVIGSGGREHTLVWKIAQSSKVEQIFCAPGNAGIAQQARLVDIKAEDIDALLEFALKEKIDLTVVGPEVPLVNGVVDRFQEKGLKIFGPGAAAARLEGSKVFAKEIMSKYNVPTAGYEVFQDSQKAKDYIAKKGAPVVIKADGLAAGKGVIMAQTIEEALKAIDDIMEDKVFGSAGEKVLIEDCLTGEEASILVVCDGENIVSLASSQDHKRVFDQDQGPNTGGMGAYSPAPVITDDLLAIIIETIINPVIKGLKQEGRIYKGILYAGLMITSQGPKVIEFNVRFGDPETQVILPRLKSDLIDVFSAAIDGSLDQVKLDWDSRACICVVMASGGYPGKYEKGKIISGLDQAAGLEDVLVFQAGTVLDNNSNCVTVGGRVLGVTARAEDIKKAIDKAYEAVSTIQFEGAHFRKDIAYRALDRKGHGRAVL